MLHLSHPAYPSRAQLDAEADAARRDRRDAEVLANIQCIIGTTLDAMLPHAAALEHPYAELSPEEIITQLQEWLEDIKLEFSRLRGPLVLEDNG